MVYVIGRFLIYGQASAGYLMTAEEKHHGHYRNTGKDQKAAG